jgi:hypothetical protein
METTIKQKIDSNVFEQGCLIQLKIFGPGFTGKLSDEVLADSQLPLEITRAMQDRIDRTMLRERQALKSRVKNYIDNNSITHPIPGLTFVPKAKIKELDDKLKEFREDDRNQVDQFLIEYPRLQREFELKYPEYYDPKHYPSVAKLRDKFQFEWRFLQLSLPENSGILTPEIYEAERDKFQQEMEQWRTMILNEVAGAFMIRLDSLVQQEEKGTMNAGTMNAINTFLKKFDSLWDGFVFSEEMKKLVMELKQYAGTVERDRIKDNPIMQRDIAAKAKELAAKLESVPDVTLKRAIDF